MKDHSLTIQVHEIEHFGDIDQAKDELLGLGVKVLNEEYVEEDECVYLLIQFDLEAAKKLLADEDICIDDKSLIKQIVEKENEKD